MYSKATKSTAKSTTSNLTSGSPKKPSPGLKDPEFLLRFHSGHNNQLRLLHYPPIPAAQLENEPSARMPAPSDWGSITILFQDDCGGLEVENQHAPGRFIKVIPLKNAIVMNIGDLLMRRSNSELIQLAAFLLMLNCRLSEVHDSSRYSVTGSRSVYWC